MMSAVRRGVTTDVSRGRIASQIINHASLRNGRDGMGIG